MTRQIQKDAERATLTALLSALGVAPDQVREDEQPDFLLSMSDRTVGVEVTMYQSGRNLGTGTQRRQVESAWEALQRASRQFRMAEADIGNVNVGEGFRMPSGVRKPPKHEPAGMRRRSMGISVFGRAR